MIAAQQTLRAPVRITGIGVHGGLAAAVTLRPAPADHGLQFLRPGGAPTPARVEHVSASAQRTALKTPDGEEIATVEHLLAACFAAGLDAALIEAEGPELPILDGSALPWLQAIEAAGLEPLAAPRRRLRVIEAVEVRDGAKRAALIPAEAPALAATIRFPDPVIGVQSLEVAFTPESIAREIIPARTFGYLADLDRFRAMGLARGASLANTVAVMPEGVANPEGLRFPDEFVRHKLLDVVGDLALAGAPIHARYEADQPGHALNAALVRALLARPQAWRLEPASAVGVAVA